MVDSNISGNKSESKISIVGLMQRRNQKRMYNNNFSRQNLGKFFVVKCFMNVKHTKIQPFRYLKQTISKIF